MGGVSIRVTASHVSFLCSSVSTHNIENIKTGNGPSFDSRTEKTCYMGSMMEWVCRRDNILDPGFSTSLTMWVMPAL